MGEPQASQTNPTSDLRGGDENTEELHPSTSETGLFSSFTVPDVSAKSTPQARPDVEPIPVTGVANPSFVDEPPPYSPPDPKTVHLLYPGFQSSVCGQGTIFYQPVPLQHAGDQPNALPGPYPFTIYNNALFTEIPIQAERSRRRPPKDYLIESVLVTLFCCLLTGAIALIYSHKTRAALNRGNLIQAKAASQKTRSLVRFSLAFGVFFSVSWVVYALVTLYM